MLDEYKRIAVAYLEAYRNDQHDGFLLDNIEQIMDDPLDALDLIVAMLMESKSDQELAYVAAGPLEDAFIKYHDILFDPLDTLIRTNATMRRAMTGIWVREGSEARFSLNKLLDKYQLQYGSL